MNAKDFLPILALVFTVASFWWLWLRSGRLTASAPRFFAAAANAQQVRIRFPLVLHNSGARPIVVEDLRLSIDDRQLDWISTRKTVRTLTDDWVDFASPFAVPDRAALSVIAEFGEDASGWKPEAARCYQVTIEWFSREEWRPLVLFEWWAPPAATMGQYIGHRNRQPSTPTPALDMPEPTGDERAGSA